MSVFKGTHDTNALEMAISAALEKAIPLVLKKALPDILDEAVFKRDEFTDALTEYFREAMDGNDCFLSFDSGRPRILAGFGDPLYDCSFNFEVEFTYDAIKGAGECAREGMRRTLSGIDDFIEELKAARDEIAAALNDGGDNDAAS